MAENANENTGRTRRFSRKDFITGNWNRKSEGLESGSRDADRSVAENKLIETIKQYIGNREERGTGMGNVTDKNAAQPSDNGNRLSPNAAQAFDRIMKQEKISDPEIRTHLLLNSDLRTALEEAANTSGRAKAGKMTKVKNDVKKLISAEPATTHTTDLKTEAADLGYSPASSEDVELKNLRDGFVKEVFDAKKIDFGQNPEVRVDIANDANITKLLKEIGSASAEEKEAKQAALKTAIEQKIANLNSKPIITGDPVVRGNDVGEALDQAQTWLQKLGFEKGKNKENAFVGAQYVGGGLLAVDGARRLFEKDENGNRSFKKMAFATVEAAAGVALLFNPHYNMLNNLLGAINRNAAEQNPGAGRAAGP